MFAIGDKVFIRTVTYHMVGKIVAKEGSWVELEDASWIADSGRFHKAINSGQISESENIGTAFVNLATACDAFPWQHDLPVPTR